LPDKVFEQHALRVTEQVIGIGDVDPACTCPTKDRKFFIPWLLSHCESVGSIVMVPTMTPVDFVRTRSFRVAPTELEG